MSLKSIEKVMQAESRNQERKLAAEAEARQIITNAEREGLALLAKTRADTEEAGREKMRQAEARAEQQAAKIAETAKIDSAALQETASKRLEEAAEFIVGRVVNH